MRRRLFLGVDPLLTDGNLDFEFMTEAQVKEAEKEAESVYEWLTEAQFQNWFEIACSKKNLIMLERLCKAMREELGL